MKKWKRLFSLVCAFAMIFIIKYNGICGRITKNRH